MVESIIMEASMLRNGGSMPSGLDVDEWHRFSTSRAFGRAAAHLHETFVHLIKKLCIEKLESTPYLDSFAACSLIPLDKDWAKTNWCRRGTLED